MNNRGLRNRFFILLIGGLVLSAGWVGAAEIDPGLTSMGISSAVSAQTDRIPIAFAEIIHAPAAIPLPVANTALSRPNWVSMGKYAVNVSSYRVDIPHKQLRHAYRLELQRRGWHLAFLPWQQTQVEVISNLEAQLEENPNGKGAEQARAHLSELRATLVSMLDRQIFVVRGQERGIVQISPYHSAGAEVVIFTWSHNVEVPPHGLMSDDWLKRNALCQTEQVTAELGLERTLPHNEALIIVAVSRAEKDPILSLMGTSTQSANEAVAFYRQQMKALEWSLVDGLEKPAQADDPIERHRLAFVDQQGRSCLVMIQQPAEDSRSTVTVITDIRE